MHNVLAPVLHPDPASHLNSATRVKSKVQSLEVVTESKRPIQLYPKIRWDWTGWQQVAIVVNIELTFGFSVVKIKSRRHRFRIAELQPPSLEIT